MTPEAATSVRPPASRAKRLLRIVAAGLAVVLAVEVCFFLARTWSTVFPRPGITRQNAERIRCGMSHSEVEAILGGPAGDYRTVATACLPELTPLGGVDERDYPNSMWKGDAGIVCVMFDSADRVAGFFNLPNAVFFYDTRRVRINPEAYSLIKEGMSISEVIFILGAYPGNYRTDPTVWYPERPESFAVLLKQTRFTNEECEKPFWEGDEGCIHVEYSAEGDGGVKSKYYWPGKKRE